VNSTFFVVIVINMFHMLITNHTEPGEPARWSTYLRVKIPRFLKFLLFLYPYKHKPPLYTFLAQVMTIALYCTYNVFHLQAYESTVTYIMLTVEGGSLLLLYIDMILFSLSNQNQ
jgi:hypothetical protein